MILCIVSLHCKMTKKEKLFKRLLGLPKDLRFEELDKIVSVGYVLERTEEPCHLHQIWRQHLDDSSQSPSRAILFNRYSRKLAIHWKTCLMECKMNKTIDYYLNLPYTRELILNLKGAGLSALKNFLAVRARAKPLKKPCS